MHTSLFAQVVKDFQILRVTAEDTRRETDKWLDLRKLLMQSEHMYPRIGKWITSKVRRGLSAGDRAAFVGYYQGLPAVSSIVKRGELAKFCHLKVDESLRDSNIGEFFFALMTMEVKRQAKRVHFTLPEGLWAEKRAFFSSFAFQTAIKSEKQYRLFEDELHCCADFDDVWRSVVRKLPKLRAALSVGSCSHDSDLLMSLRPQHAEAVLDGRKTVELRRSFSHRWLGSRLTLYASAPISSIVGEAVIDRLVEWEPKAVWNEFASALACSREEFEKYSAGAEKVYAIILTDVRRYATPFALSAARTLVDPRLRPPQSYSQIKVDSSWAEALPIAGLLQTIDQHQFI